MRRPQFTLKTILWLMAMAGAFCAGRRSQISDALREEREAMTQREAGLTDREKAVYLDEAKLMKGWHQFQLGAESLRKAREQYIEMGRKQAKDERDNETIQQTLARLRPSRTEDSPGEEVGSDGQR